MKKILSFALLVFPLGANAASVYEQFSINQQVKVSVSSTASTQFLGENLNRGYLMIQNLDTAATLSVTVGVNSASVAGIQIPPNGGAYEFAKVPTAHIFLLSTVNNSSAAILEGNVR